MEYIIKTIGNTPFTATKLNHGGLRIELVGDECNPYLFAKELSEHYWIGGINEKCANSSISFFTSGLYSEFCSGVGISSNSTDEFILRDGKAIKV